MARILIAAAVAALCLLASPIPARAGSTWTNAWSSAWTDTPTSIWHYATMQVDLYNATLERAVVAGMDTNSWENPAGTSIWHDIGFLFDFDTYIGGLCAYYVDDKTYSLDAFYASQQLYNGQLAAMRKFERTNLCLYAIGKTNYTRPFTTGYTSIWHYASTNDLWERRKCIEALTTMEVASTMTSTQRWGGPEYWSAFPGNNAVRTISKKYSDPAYTNLDCTGLDIDTEWLDGSSYWNLLPGGPISAWNYQNAVFYRTRAKLDDYPTNDTYTISWGVGFGRPGHDEDGQQLEADYNGLAANDYAINVTNLPYSHIANVYLCWSTNRFEEPNQTNRQDGIPFSITLNYVEWDDYVSSCDDPWHDATSGGYDFPPSSAEYVVVTNIWADGLIYTNLPVMASNVISDAWYNQKSWTWFDDNCPRYDDFVSRMTNVMWVTNNMPPYIVGQNVSRELSLQTAEGGWYLFNNQGGTLSFSDGGRQSYVKVRAYANYDATNGFRYVNQ